MSENNSTKVDLVGSYFESWGLYLKNLDTVWGFTFTAGFRAIGALFSGKLIQMALATTDFYLRLKDGDSLPSANFSRIMDLTNTQIGVDQKALRKGAGNEMLTSILGVLIAVLGAPIGLVVGGVIGMLVHLGFLGALVGFFAPLAIGGIIYFRSLAVMMLGAGLFIKFGPEEIKQRQQEADATVQQHTPAFAFYAMAALISSWAGLVLCCIGVFFTVPFAPTAFYVGMINTLEITTADVDKFLSATGGDA